MPLPSAQLKLILALVPLLAGACSATQLFSAEDLLADPQILELGDEVAVYTSDGEIILGTLVTRTANTLVLETHPGRQTPVAREEIAFIERRGGSAGKTIAALGIGAAGLVVLAAGVAAILFVLALAALQ